MFVDIYLTITLYRKLLRRNVCLRIAEAKNVHMFADIFLTIAQKSIYQMYADIKSIFRLLNLSCGPKRFDFIDISFITTRIFKGQLTTLHQDCIKDSVSEACLW